LSGARKPLHVMGSSHADLKAFPDEARRDAGFNLDFVQRGLEPGKLEADEDCGHGGQRQRDIDLAKTRFKTIPTPERKPARRKP
jgi:phage-related protein